jgi:hypothetical protein
MTFGAPRETHLPPARMIGVLIFCCVMSGLVAGGIQVLLHVWLGTNLALAYALRTLAIVTLATTVVLAVAWQRARAASAIDLTALVLIGFVVLGKAWRQIGGAPSRDDLAVLLEAALPMVVMILFQWYVLRENWRHRNTAA